MLTSKIAKGKNMKNKVTTTILATLLVAMCLIALCSCAPKANQIVEVETQEDAISFGKKYYALSGYGVDKNQYYTFNKDGTATYHVTIEENGKVTYKSNINFKWFYADNGQFVLLHNGTKVLEGKHDDAMGFGRVMHATKCVMYWDNMYFVAEDCANSIPNFGKFVGNFRKLLELKK